MSKTTEKELTNILARGIITSTSKKVSTEFKADTPTMTAFLNIVEEDKQKLIDFGLTEYESKDENKEKKKDKFFIVKFSATLKIYIKQQQGNPVPFSKDCTVSNNIPNFQTEEGKIITMNFIKGNKAGKDFIRLQAVLLENESELVDIIEENPFEGMM